MYDRSDWVDSREARSDLLVLVSAWQSTLSLAVSAASGRSVASSASFAELC